MKATAEAVAPMTDEEIEERNQQLENRGCYAANGARIPHGRYRVQRFGGNSYGAVRVHPAQTTAGRTIMHCDETPSRFSATAAEAFDDIEQFLTSKEAEEQKADAARREEARKEQEQERQWKQAQSDKRVDAACVPAEHRSLAPDQLNAPADAVKAVKDYIEDFNYFSGSKCLGIIFFGPVGTDKTRLACALVEALARTGKSVLYSTLNEVLHTASVTDDPACNPLLAPKLLVVDGVGVTYGDESLGELVRNLAAKNLRWLLQTRWNNKKPSVLVCDRDKNWLRAYLGKEILEGTFITPEGSRRTRDWEWFEFEAKAAPKTLAKGRA